MRAQQPRHRKGGEAGHERLTLAENVAATLDRANRRGVRRWPADTESLELLDQRCLGVSGRRGGFMTLGFEIEQMQPRPGVARDDVADGQFWQRTFLLAELGDWIIAAFNVGTPESGELDHFA